MTATKERMDDVRLAALENVARQTWTEGDIAREGILDLCADLRAARGLPQTPGIDGSAMPATAQGSTDRPETIEETRARMCAEIDTGFQALERLIVEYVPRNYHRVRALRLLFEAWRCFNDAVAEGEAER